MNNVQTPLIHHLGDVLREAREGIGMSRENLARLDPEFLTSNSLLRVELKYPARFWPREPERLVALYAGATGVAPVELWKEALRRWESAQPVARGLAQQVVTLAQGQAAQRAASPAPARPKKRRENR